MNIRVKLFHHHYKAFKDSYKLKRKVNETQKHMQKEQRLMAIELLEVRLDRFTQGLVYFLPQYCFNT